MAILVGTIEDAELNLFRKKLRIFRNKLLGPGLRRPSNSNPVGMSTKFGNLEDFFDFLELKRAEIEESFRAQMTRELEEAQVNEIDELSGNANNYKDIKDAEYNNESIKSQLQTDFIPDEGIQLVWSTSLETPKTSKHAPNYKSSFNDMDEYDFDSVGSSPKREQTDTTLIMEQLNLNEEEEVDYVLSGYSEDLNILEENERVASPKDPFDLLSFPISQFPVDFEEENEHSINSIQEVNDTFIKENQFDELDDLLSEFDLIESSKGMDDCDLDLDLDIPMSQFPNTQMMMNTNSDCNNYGNCSENRQDDLFIGFSTGRGKKLPPPSDEVLKKALKIIEIGDEIIANKEQTIDPPKFDGFSTGRGEELPEPSREAMKRARSLMELDSASSEEGMKRSRSLFDGDTTDPVRFGPVGFATAKGKSLPLPSKAALERAKQLIGETGDTAEPITVQFSTGKGVKVPPPSEEALKRAAELVQSIDSMSSENQPPPNGLTGFSTGKGRSLPPPSEEAIKRAKKLVEDDKDSGDPKWTESIKHVTKTKTLPSTLRSSLNEPPPKKPFSLSSAWKRTRRPPQTLKPAPPVKIKLEPVKLFELSAIGMQRYNLKEFFQQTPNLRLGPSDYESFGM